jgi:hypothetical protein
MPSGRDMHPLTVSCAGERVVGDGFADPRVGNLRAVLAVLTGEASESER